MVSSHDERMERDRIARVYKGYSSDPYYSRIWSGEMSRLIVNRKWEHVSRTLCAEGINTSTASFLDLGAGVGEDCDRFRQLGFQLDRVVAIDILSEYLFSAKIACPRVGIVQADGAWLPFRDRSFDVVHQSTMLSSVLDYGRRAQILREVLRVMKPGGLFVSYDLRYPNPWNKNTRLVAITELRAAFPQCSVRARSVTPIPQLVRFLGPLASPMWRIIESIPPLRSHLLAVVRKP